MLKKVIGLLPVLAFALACTSCDGISFSYHDRRPVQRHVTRVAHVCGHDCHHHYYNGTRLVVLRGHRHGPSCGHHWNGTHWVIVAKGNVRHGHGHRAVRPPKTGAVRKGPGKRYRSSH